MEKKEVKQIQLTDVGTRYTHIRDLLDTLEISLEVLQEVSKTRRFTPEEHEKFVKMLITYEIINIILNSMSKVKDDMTEYKLFKMVDSIPAAKDLEGYIPYERIGNSADTSGRGNGPSNSEIGC
jgi:hypothetical protein